MADEPRITDPQRVRALAHPLRLELLDVLKIEGEATATRCAELTSESVASCSFHLRMLAKYGFVEEVERPGRQKPWRRTAAGFSASADFDSPESVNALQEMSTFIVEREADRLRGWIARAGQEPAEWIEASSICTSAFWATSKELAELNAAMLELTERFKDRWDDPKTRPEGARIARLLSATSVDPDRHGITKERSTASKDDGSPAGKQGDSADHTGATHGENSTSSS